jgi:hypothetical protein
MRSDEATPNPNDADAIRVGAVRAEDAYSFEEAAALWLRLAELLRPADMDEASTAYARAARCIEKTERNRIVARLWAAAGDALGLADSSALRRPERQRAPFNQEDLFGVLQTRKWHAPYELRSTDETADRLHRQAWVYEWAAQRCGVYGEHSNAVMYRRLEGIACTELLKRRPMADYYRRRTIAYAESCCEHAIAFGSLPEAYASSEYSEAAPIQMIDDYEEMRRGCSDLLVSADGAKYYPLIRRFHMQIYRELLSAGNTVDGDRVYLELAEIRERKARRERRLGTYLWMRTTHILSMHGTSVKRLVSAVTLVFLVAYPLAYFVTDVISCSGASATLLDCAYFSIVTAATVGFGDCVPKASFGRCLVMSEIACSLFFLAVLTQLITRRAIQRS